MQKVLVTGCPGAGKSPIARRLQGLTGLPLYYLDRLWHRPDRTNVTREAFDRGLAQWLARPSNASFTSLGSRNLLDLMA